MKKTIEVVEETDEIINPIVFLNNPIESIKEDIMGLDPTVNAIKLAISQNAKMIGVIANFGSGKSSLTELLASKISANGSSIKINMWDSLNIKKKSASSVTDLTKIFLFQLALGYDNQNKKSSYANYINKKLSRNFSSISFGISNWTFWIYLFFSGLFYCTGLTLKSLTYSEIHSIMNLFFPFIDFSISVLIKNISYILEIISISILIVGFYKNKIVYSHWKNQTSRELEINDIFEIYGEIAFKLTEGNNNNKRLVIIEDLDRIEAKNAVIGFLKEIYRFQNLLGERFKSKIVFIVSIKPETLLLNTENENVVDSNIYSKIFDYTVNLKPIHYDDYESVLISIIDNCDKSTKDEIEMLVGGKIVDKLPQSFYWLLRGKNLTLRDLKERLDKSISLMISLKNKKYRVNSSINFSTCAAVVFLENQYSQFFQKLLENEDIFADIIRKSYNIRNSSDILDAKQELLKNMLITIYNSLEKDIKIEDFLDATSKMILRGDIDDDFRIYFYSYPKGSYIKTSDEKDISLLLLYPLDYQFDEEINEKIERITSSNIESNIIKDCLIRISDEKSIRFPKIIFENEYLFICAVQINESKVLDLLSNQLKWEFDDLEQNAALFSSIFKYSNPKKNEFFGKYMAILVSKIRNFENELKIEIRMELIAILSKDIMIFKELYIGGELNELNGFPMISESEINQIHDNSISLFLIDYRKIAEENISYLAKLMNGQKYNKAGFDYSKKILDTALAKVNNVKLAPYLLEFLTLYGLIDDTYFLVIVNQANINSLSVDSIKNYLNNIVPSRFSNVYLAEIDKLMLDSGLSSSVLNSLESHDFYLTYLLSQFKADKLKDINFSLDRICNLVKKNLAILIALNPDIVFALRTTILSSYQNFLNQYLELFFGEYPLISFKEMILFSDFVSSLEYLNISKVSDNNVDDIYQYFNNSYRDPIECFEVFRFLGNRTYIEHGSFTSKSVELIFTKLNFELIDFKGMSEVKKEETVQSIKILLNLNIPKNCVDFMRKVQCLVKSLEEVLIASGSLTDYISLINDIDQPTDFTIKWLISYDNEIPVAQNTSSELLKNSAFSKYIVGKTLFDQKLVLNLDDINIDEYIKLYLNSDNMFRYLASNDEFINKVINNELYTQFSKNKLLPLYKHRQTINLFKFLFSLLTVIEFETYLDEFPHLDKSEDSKLLLVFIKLGNNYEKFATKRSRSLVKEKFWTSGDRQSFTKYMSKKYPD